MTWRATPLRVAAIVALCGVLAACGTGSDGGGERAAQATSRRATTTTDAGSNRPTPATTTLPDVPVVAPEATVPAPAPPSTPARTDPPAPPPAPARSVPPSGPLAPYVPPDVPPDVSFVSAAQLGPSWRPGCPVGPDQLRMLTVTYTGFDGADHIGQLIVHVDAVPALRTVFARLHTARFPIRSIVPIDVYGASDAASLAADNTAAFNCRLAVNPGAPPSWSEHAYGRAIDVNPVENPYIYSDGTVDPAAGGAFLDRADHRPGMAHPGSPLNEAFAAVGWSWGGVWAANPDYQHFSATGG